MRVTNFMMIAAVTLGAAGSARAQTAATPAATPVTQTGGVTTPDTIGTTASHWTAAGFVGANLDSNADVAITNTTNRSGVDYGGQVAYLWRGIVGPEFLAGYSPSFKMNNLLLAEDPHVSTYMANAIGVLPLGAKGHIQPYLSGGYGSMGLRTNVITVTATTLPAETDAETASTAAPTLTTTNVTSHQSKGGSNIGAGLMAFAGNIGVRGDFRYFHSSTVTSLPSSTPADQFTEALLSGLHFWRTNVGVVFQW
jgi:hypothetical protein